MGGIGHDFKAGVNFINEPRLFITFNSGKGVLQHTHLTDDVNGPISVVTLNDGDASANIPLKQYAIYFQDDWRATDRLTINAGLRWDYITGYQFDQSLNPNFVKMQAAGAAGLLQGIKGLENCGLEPQEDNNNFQPRIGFAYDIKRRRPQRAARRLGHLHGHGLHQLERAVRRQRRHRPRLRRRAAGGQSAGHPQSRRQLLPRRAAAVEHRRARTRPWSAGSRCSASGPTRAWSMPYTRQASVGWSHEVLPSTVITLDFVRGGRPRSEHASAHQRAHRERRRLAAPAGLPRPQPERPRHPSGDQPRPRASTPRSSPASSAGC